MKQEELKELKEKFTELQKDVKSKDGYTLWLIGSKDCDVISNGLHGSKVELIIALSRSILHSDEWKEMFESSLKLADMDSGEYDKRKREAKKEIIVICILFGLSMIVGIIATCLSSQPIATIVVSCVLHILMNVGVFIITAALIKLINRV